MTEKHYDYIKNPQEIENRSFEIIGEEMGEHQFSENELKIIKRIIHTTADFEYQNLTHIHPDAIRNGLEALKSGCDIYADTNMITMGVNKRALEKLGCRIYNLVNDEEVVKTAKEQGITRSMAGIDKAASDQRIKIFAVGNAPTALYRIMELEQQGKVHPMLIIGAPVGFVGAAESKEALLESGLVNITTRGRKGGSTIVVSIINALLYILDEDRW